MSRQLAVAAAPLQVPAGGGLRPGGRDYFEKLVADGQQRVFQTEVGDARVPVADLQVEHLAERPLGVTEPFRHQRDLPQSQPHAVVSPPSCVRPVYRPGRPGGGFPAGAGMRHITAPVCADVPA